MSLVLRRILTVAFSILVILALLVGYLNFVWVPQTAQKSFPQVEGELRLTGLQGPVDLYRDSMGIPHIYATTLHDLFMAQGYVHAQDRFWQMDFWRHIGSGRLSEMFGASQVQTDAFLRTLGWRQLAEQEYQMLSSESKAILDAYTEGVNAYLANRTPVEVSLEYAILTTLLNRTYTIEPWTPIHSLTWAKAMAWDLRGNMGAEIERAILLKTLSPEQVNELFPPYPAEHPRIVPEMPKAFSGRQSGSPATTVLHFNALDQAAINLNSLAGVLGPGGAGIGSNSWVISGERSLTGKPLLANDPHLGIQMPSIWYQISLHCRPKSDMCPFEVAGFSFAGVPGVVIGHNERIAWGFTNVGPDVMDLYVLKLNPANLNQYELNGQWIDFETRTEMLQVAGGESVQVNVRVSRFGPVISDTYGPLKDEVEPDSQATPFKDQAGIELPTSYAIALRWTALEPNPVFEAIWGFNKAQNWEEFRQAARKFTVPAQNLLYADVEGNIGYQMPGNIPLRNKGDGRLPVPGWTDEYAWTGYIPFEQLPWAFNPASGYIVTANNQVPPDDYPYLISTDWDYGYRAARIVEMIENAPGKIDAAYFQTMQTDSESLNARNLLPLVLALPAQGRTAEVRDYFLKSWNRQETADSQAALFFERYWWNLLMEIFGDEAIPVEYQPAGGARWYAVVQNLLQQPNSAWWDDKNTTDKIETRDDILLRALEVTVNVGEEKYGKDYTRWPVWGAEHRAMFRNATLGKSGIAPLEALFNRGPFATGGGDGIVNATAWDVGVSFEVNWLPSMRMIVDLSNWDNSLTVHTTGQSGHAYHPHYIDLADLWSTGQYYPMRWSEQAVLPDSKAHLRLTP
ncbi:MAG: penicillin acylase family protein [Anaerolineae bacterium]|nr:MAG: penicillin acylase family protein [Anaerolineae bacterium]